MTILQDDEAGARRRRLAVIWDQGGNELRRQGFLDDRAPVLTGALPG
jgi:hypothetical protein